MDPATLRKALSRHASALKRADKALQLSADLPDDVSTAAYSADEVVRELNAKRIWCAEALLSSNADEVRRLLIQAQACKPRQHMFYTSGHLTGLDF